jgi:hypothetical protein
MSGSTTQSLDERDGQMPERLDAAGGCHHIVFFLPL